MSARLRAANERHPEEYHPALLIALLPLAYAVIRYRRWKANGLSVRPLGCTHCGNFQYGEFGDWCEDCGYAIHTDAYR